MTMLMNMLNNIYIIPEWVAQEYISKEIQSKELENALSNVSISREVLDFDAAAIGNKKRRGRISWGPR